MEKSKHLTEEDFQNYFENSMADDNFQFNEHIRECKQCNESFQTYSIVWSFVRNDFKIESSQTNFAATVADKVFMMKRNRFVFEYILIGILILLCIISISICFKFLIANSTPFVLLLLTTVPLLFYFMLSLKEISILRNKFGIYL